MLARERRLSPETVEAISATRANSCNSSPATAAGRRGLRTLPRFARRICAASWPTGAPAQSRGTHAGSRPCRHPLAAALPRTPRPRQCGRGRCTSRAAPAEVAAEAADRQRRKARRLGRRPACRRTVDRRAQRCGADFALRFGPAHFRGAGHHRCGAFRAGRRRAARHRQGRKTRLAPVLPAPSQAVAEYRKLCPYHLDPKGLLFRGARGGPLNPAIIQREMKKMRSALNLPEPPRRMRCGIPSRRICLARRRFAHDPGTARTCQPVDDAALYRRRYGGAAQTYDAAHPRA